WSGDEGDRPRPRSAFKCGERVWSIRSTSWSSVFTSFRGLTTLRSGLREADDELRVAPLLGLDAQAALVQAHDDVVADRQPEPRPGAGRLGREEGVEDPLAQVRRHAGAVVAEAHLYFRPGVARRDDQLLCEARPLRLPPLGGGVTGVLRQVQDDAAQF